MKVIESYDLVNEAGEVKTLPAGAYVCKLIEVIDVPEKEYLDVYFDITEGPFKGYFSILQKNTGKNYGRIARSYKESAVPFFKAFIKAIEKSNVGYAWNWDEKSLNGKTCVVVFRDEEYEKDGEVRVMAKADEIRSVEALQQNKIVIKPLKKLEKPVTETVAPVTPIADGDLPF